MKKKILMFLIALFMFIPLTIVKADDLDAIIERLNERIYFSDSYIRQIESNIEATKVDDDKLKVTVTTDMSDAYQTMPEGFIDDENMTFTSFVIYEYKNKILSYKGNFGYIDAEGNTIDYKTTDKDIWAETLATQNEPITKELIYVLYSLKTQKSYPDITTYLKSVGLEKEDGHLSYPTENLPEGITITKDGEGWLTEYSIKLNQINIPENANNNENGTNNDNNNNNNTDKKTDYNLNVGEDFKISFTDNANKDYFLNVNLMQDNKDGASEESRKKEIQEVKELINKNGEYIEWYSITVQTQSGSYKEDGPFTLKIKKTDEMKKYDTFEFINIFADDDGKLVKGDVVKMKVDGDYLVGELPHLSTYALVGKKIENPSTGVTKYTVSGVALLLTTLGVYTLYKRKNEI